MTATRHVVLNVPDVSCNHCKTAIENAVSGLPGVDAVEVEIESKSVAVELEPAGRSRAPCAAPSKRPATRSPGEHEFAL